MSVTRVPKTRREGCAHRDNEVGQEMPVQQRRVRVQAETEAAPKTSKMTRRSRPKLTECQRSSRGLKRRCRKNAYMLLPQTSTESLVARPVPALSHYTPRRHAAACLLNNIHEPAGVFTATQRSGSDVTNTRRDAPRNHASLHNTRRAFRRARWRTARASSV